MKIYYFFVQQYIIQDYSPYKLENKENIAKPIKRNCRKRSWEYYRYGKVKKRDYANILNKTVRHG